MPGKGRDWERLEAEQRETKGRALSQLAVARVWSSTDATLGALPDGSAIALVSMLGSLCPVTRGHVQCFEGARALLLSGRSPAGRFASCVGLLTLTST